jgi:hypothetical protein
VPSTGGTFGKIAARLREIICDLNHIKSCVSALHVLGGVRG